MKKKVFTVAVSLLTILLLVACGNNKKSTDTSSSEIPKTSSSQKAEQSSKTIEFSTTAIDTVIYEGKGVTLTYKGLEKDDYEYTLKLAYKNTSNKEYEVQTRNGKVNNISNNDDHKIIICSDTLKASATSEETVVFFWIFGIRSHIQIILPYLLCLFSIGLDTIVLFTDLHC